MLIKDEDELILDRFQAGDKEVFNALFTKYQHRIHKITLKFVHEPNEAMDIVQEVFIKAYRALDRFQRKSTFYTWLYRITINTSKNHLMVQGRSLIDHYGDYQEEAFLEAHAYPYEYVTPENTLFSEELEAVLNQTIGRLPEELRTAILLREIEGLSYDQIAHTMACPVGTVRSRIFRARESIEKNISPLLAR